LPLGYLQGGLRYLGRRIGFRHAEEQTSRDWVARLQLLVVLEHHLNAPGPPLVSPLCRQFRATTATMAARKYARQYDSIGPRCVTAGSRACRMWSLLFHSNETVSSPRWSTNLSINWLHLGRAGQRGMEILTERVCVKRATRPPSRSCRVGPAARWSTLPLARDSSQNTAPW
jgi:hypothetical protein